MADLAVVILTYNEERHIGRALASIAGIASQVFVIDSFSKDATLDIARDAGAVVLQNPFVNQARQFQWAMDNAPITASWIMRLDADEIIEPDLVARIAEELPKLGADVAGINLWRKHVFMGRWIRHGGRYPVVLLRIFRRGQGHIEDRWMDEHILVEGGSTVTFQSGFSDHSLHDLTFFTDKHNKYATREALDVLCRRHGLTDAEEGISVQGTSRQSALKRLIKEKVYNRLPFWFGPLAYFLYRYFLQLGFLDGKPGLIYHFLQGFWYRFLVGAKLEELEAALAAFSTVEGKKAELARLTGLKL